MKSLGRKAGGKKKTIPQLAVTRHDFREGLLWNGAMQQLTGIKIFACILPIHVWIHADAIYVYYILYLHECKSHQWLGDLKSLKCRKCLLRVTGQSSGQMKRLRNPELKDFERPQ